MTKKIPATSGFVYIWYDRKHKRYYIGSHWGTEADGYISSSSWMKQAYKHRPYDFKRRILTKNILDRKELLIEEDRILNMIKKEELGKRYYNLANGVRGHWSTQGDGKILTVGEKISKARKGKPITFSDPEERGRKIAAGKKAAFEKRKAETGSTRTDEWRAKQSEAAKQRRHTEEWKANNSAKLKEQWASGQRDHLRKEKAPPIPRGAKLKELWADPVWAANQRAKLKEGSARRYELNTSR